MAVTQQEEIGEDGVVKDQKFNKMATRVGGPPRGPPPATTKPGGAPKGAPPGGRRNSKAAPPVKGVKGSKAAAGGAAAASNSKVPKAPPVAHYICYVKGEPFTSAASTDIPAGDDLDLDAAADIANMSAIVDGLGGGDEPFMVDEAPGGGDPRSDPGGLAAALAAPAAQPDQPRFFHPHLLAEAVLLVLHLNHQFLV